MRCVAFLFLFGLLASAAGAAEAPVEGRASVIDGDTLDIHGIRIRLHGVDAPEAAQMCSDAGNRPVRCGTLAARALADKIGTAPLSCTPLDRDQYGRTVARCLSGGENINAWLVENGWAVAYRAYSRDYVGQEDAARQAKRGIWKGAFLAPAQYRAQRRQPQPQPQPQAAPAGADAAGCRIKGNINAAQECIFHEPGSRDYDKTVVTPSRGERFFCTVAEALVAGCRAPR
jgi:endonuclease YncB( thermonuclease family)